MMKCITPANQIQFTFNVFHDDDVFGNL